MKLYRDKVTVNMINAILSHEEFIHIDRFLIDGKVYKLSIVIDSSGNYIVYNSYGIETRVYKLPTIDCARSAIELYFSHYTRLRELGESMTIECVYCDSEVVLHMDISKGITNKGNEYNYNKLLYKCTRCGEKFIDMKLAQHNFEAQKSSIEEIKQMDKLNGCVNCFGYSDQCDCIKNDTKTIKPIDVDKLSPQQVSEYILGLTDYAEVVKIHSKVSYKRNTYLNKAMHWEATQGVIEMHLAKLLRGDKK